MPGIERDCRTKSPAVPESLCYPTVMLTTFVVTLTPWASVTTQ